MHVLGLFVSQVSSTSSSPFLGAIVMLAMGVLLVVIGFLLAYVLFERRIERLPLGRTSAAPAPAGAQNTSPPARPARPAGMVCPACRREYDAGVRHCAHDAKLLVPADGGPPRGAAGGICPTCKRAFDPGVKYCPHDAEELIPMAFWEATHGRARPAGVVGKICPACAAKYDIEATFCGK